MQDEWKSFFSRDVIYETPPSRLEKLRTKKFHEWIETNPIPETAREIKTPFERFVQKRELTNLPLQEQREIYDNYKTIMQALHRNKPVEYTVENETKLRALIMALKDISSNTTKELGMTTYNKRGKTQITNISPATINYLERILEDANYEPEDLSGKNFVKALNNLSRITLQFKRGNVWEKPKPQRTRRGAPFFPFFNTVKGLDLSKYGIYHNEQHPKINQACFVTAIEECNILTDDEFNALKSFIHTREVLMVDLQEIAEIFNIFIHLEYKYFMDRKTEKSNKFYSELFGEIYSATHKYNETAKRKANIMIFKIDNNLGNFSHFMTSECVDADTCRQFGFRDCNGKTKQGLSITTVIAKMFERKMFKAIPERMKNKLDFSFKHEIKEYNFSRPVKIHDRKYCNDFMPEQGKKFFSFDAADEDKEMYLNQLQKMFDILLNKNQINVRKYANGVILMQKLMYEYGCYEGVMESSGTKNQEIRKSLIHPETGTHNKKPLVLDKGPYYYIDMNGAYMSVINGIPHTIEPSSKVNYKINELIQRLFEFRNQAKAKDNPMHKCIKNMMVSAFGYSYRKPKPFKNKYPKDVKKYVAENQKFLAIYDDERVTEILPFSPHFNCVQFAKSILDNYHELMQKISSLVNVLYSCVDAILISEADYKKLEELGYIGSKLGQFKIDKIFSEFVIKSKVKWLAKFVDGTVFHHCVPETVDYELFKQETLELVLKDEPYKVSKKRK